MWGKEGVVEEMADISTKQIDRNLHVVYASDDKFAEILGVSLTSLYMNNKEMEQINVYVLDSGIAASNKESLIHFLRSLVELPFSGLRLKILVKC